MSTISTQYLELQDVKIAYREYGSGPVLLLLHGNSGSKENFSKYQQDHFRNFHSFALDSRGHGGTISSDAHLSIDQISEDVIAFCKAKNIDQAFVVGYSDGGNIALFLAKKEPVCFTKVVAISPNYLVSGLTDGTLKLLRAIAGLLRLLDRLGLAVQKTILRFELMLDDVGIKDEDLSGIQTDVCILYAERDVVKEEHLAEMGRLIPGATIRKIGRCNHLSMLHKRETMETIRSFLLGDGNSAPEPSDPQQL
jgi:pimeloyl-ACP methyl ester carboxylesterase